MRDALQTDWLGVTPDDLKEIDFWRMYETADAVSIEYVMKPYPNEHACRVREPGDFQKDSFRRKAQGEGSDKLFLIIGKLKGSTTTTLQAFRYPVETWDSSRARTHCKAHDGIDFEPAKSKSNSASDDWDALSHFISHEPRAVRDDVLVPDTWDVGEISARLVDLGTFFCTPEIRAVDEEQRIVEGYASTKDLDRMHEIIDPRAFKSSMERLRAKRIKLLYEHVPPAVGRIIKGKIDATGLWIRAQLAQGIARAEEAWLALQQEMLDSFSVGFQIADTEERQLDDGRTVRVITDLDLYEVSLVTIPANIYASASLVKSIQFGTDTFRRDAHARLYTPAHVHAASQLVASTVQQIGKSVLTREQIDDAYKTTSEYLRRVVGDIEGDATDDVMIDAISRIASTIAIINKGVR